MSKYDEDLIKTPPEYTIGDEYLGYGEEIDNLETKINGNREYSGTYTEQIDKAVADYMGRDKFNFNPNNSSTYQQIRDQYLGTGKKAMEDTLASASILSGGYNNSAAQVAGQQVYNDYAKAVTDYIPTLESEAYQRYLDDGNAQLQNIELLKSLDDTEYGRHLDDVNLDYQMLSHLLGRQSNAASLDANKNSFDQSNWANYEGLKQTERVNAQNQENTEWEQEQSILNTKLDYLMTLASNGVAVTVPEELQGYISQADLDNLVEKVNTPTVSYTSGGSGDDDEPTVQVSGDDVVAFKEELAEIIEESGVDAAWEWMYSDSYYEHPNITDDIRENYLNTLINPIIDKNQEHEAHIENQKALISGNIKKLW